MDPKETLGVVALGVLAVVFVAAFVVLVFICYRRQYSRPSASLHIFNSPFCRPQMLLGDSSSSAPSEDLSCAQLELEDVKLAPQIRKILNDAQWVDDATGLVPHCLAILRLCHHLSERLVASARLTPLPQSHILGIIEVSRKVSQRVDDVARAMYPPLDPRLLEARCSALTLTLALLTAHTSPHTALTSPHTALISPHTALNNIQEAHTSNAVHSGSHAANTSYHKAHTNVHEAHTSPYTVHTGPHPISLAQKDITQDFFDMERHVQVLREAADCYEAFCEAQQESSLPHQKV